MMRDHPQDHAERYGRQLIFLISQPRSGSTLLQHLLGGHTQILTAPEPWLMLNWIYGTRESGITAEYNSKYASLAVKDFLERIPNGSELYRRAIACAASSIYTAALQAGGKRFFLDKTPRYYFIAEELFEIFPQATYIFLLRNPLSVFASILQTNFSGNWKKMLAQEDRRHDLITAPKLIADAVENMTENVIVIRYEELVIDPVSTLRPICEKLGVKLEPEMLRYGGRVEFKETTFIDPRSIYKHDQVVDSYVDRWRELLDSPEKRMLAEAYVRTLDSRALDFYGYDLEGPLLAIKKSSKKSIVLDRLLSAPKSIPEHGFNRWDVAKLFIGRLFSDKKLRYAPARFAKRLLTRATKVLAGRGDA